MVYDARSAGPIPDEKGQWTAAAGDSFLNYQLFRKGFFWCNFNKFGDPDLGMFIVAS